LEWAVWKPPLLGFNRHANTQRSRAICLLGSAGLSGAATPQQPPCPRRKIIGKNPLNEFSAGNGALSNAMKVKKGVTKI
jgi:hypothetical protein